MSVTTRGWLIALVAVSTMLGAAAHTPRPVDAALSGTKTCTPNGSGVTTTSCTLSFTESFVLPPGVSFPVTMVGPAQFDPLNPPTIASATRCMTNPAVTMLTATSYRIVVQAGGCLPGANIIVTEPVIVSATDVVRQTITSSLLDPPLIVMAPVSFTPPTSPLSVTKSCKPAVLPVPAGALICTFTITNNTAVARNPLNQPDYAVQIAGPGTLADQGGPHPFNASAVVTSTVRCPASVRTDDPYQPTATTYQLEIEVESCAPGSSITVTETVTPGANGVLSQEVTRHDGATATATVSISAGHFDIRCPDDLNPDLAGATFPAVVLGPIGDAEPIAIGVLPAVLICEAAFYDAAGDRVHAASGTIEVSALKGTLVDLRGGLSTTLRIGCDHAEDAAPGRNAIDGINVCEGVRFAVLGLGVGLVELRARYEPGSLAAAAGIREASAAGDVAFVAPPVSLSLRLSPNPVAPGGGGTALLRFNRLITFRGELLINPETGAPLFINLGANRGTPLNGTVTFTSSAPVVAGFIGGNARAAPAATATVRCGSAAPATVGPATVVTVANFALFFGGCDSATVRYRGVGQGTATITASFVPDLPAAFGAAGAPGGRLQGFVDALSSVSTNTIAQTLEVTTTAAGTQRLVRGCTNVVAPANETVQQVAARVDPADAVLGVWKQTPGTARFQGAAAGDTVPASVSNLRSVSALDAVFICVNAAATYRT